MKKTIKFLTLLLFCTFFIFAVDVNTADAAGATLFDESEIKNLTVGKIQLTASEDLVFFSRDKKATSNITYQTLGFRIEDKILTTTRRYVELPMSQSEMKIWDDPDDNAYCYTMFVLTRDELESYIGKRYPGWEKEFHDIGADIELNSFMTVCDSGVPRGSIKKSTKNKCRVDISGTVYDTENGIKNAANWANKDGFKNRYNLTFTYEPRPMKFEKPSTPATKEEKQDIVDPSISLSLSNATYDPVQGIPTTESITAEVSAKCGYGKVTYNKVTETVYFPVPTTIKFKIGAYEVEQSNITVYGSKKYTYYTVKSSALYDFKNATVNIGNLGSINVRFSERDKYGTVSIDYSNSEAGRVKSKDPTFKGKTVNLGQLDKYDEQEIKEEVIEKINKVTSQAEVTVRSGKCSVNGVELLSKAETKNNGKSPKGLSTAINLIETDSNSIQIPKEAMNGNHSVTYSGNYQLLPKSNGTYKTNVPLSNIDGGIVKVHSPAVCNVKIDPSKTTQPEEQVPVLEAGENYDFWFEEYPHLSIPGYGTKLFQNYKQKWLIKMPFDGYINEEYVDKNVWKEVTLSSFKIKAADWVDTDYYTIEFKTTANNYKDSYDESAENKANLNISNYAAKDSMRVKVNSNRIYDFNVYDINDYPLWQNIFRLPNSTKGSGLNYRAGQLNWRGEVVQTNEKLTLPLMEGSHLYERNKGALKLGYTMRFNVSTRGKLSNEKDYLEITPKFCYVKKDGTGRQEVDLYYNETINGKKKYFVKVGSETDQSNQHYMQLGNTYTNVGLSELVETSRLSGIDEEVLKYVKQPVYTYGKIKLSSRLRTFVGEPTTSDASKKDQEIMRTQKWYGEYRLPSETFVAPKGYDVYEVARKSGGLTGKESFWLNSGYIVVNFDIVAYQYQESSGTYKKLMQYNNAEKNINMWEKEGYKLVKKDYSGTSFNLKYGDIAFYYTIYQSNGNNGKDKVNANTDYKSGGTH